jgi:hypothetical protein
LFIWEANKRYKVAMPQLGEHLYFCLELVFPNPPTPITAFSSKFCVAFCNSLKLKYRPRPWLEK